MSDMGTVGRDEFGRLWRRVEAMDAAGTSGVRVLAVQLQEIAKDFATHEAKHDRQEAARAARMRWLVMACIGLVAAVDGPIVTVLLAMHGGH